MLKKNHFKDNDLRSHRAQTAMEYILLLAVVVTVTVIGFYHLGPRTQYAANLYCQRAAAGIVGVPAPEAGPEPINGGWCEEYSVCDVTCGPGNQTRPCACPTPSNGGAPCYGRATRPCLGPDPVTGSWIFPVCYRNAYGSSHCHEETACSPQGSCCDFSQRPVDPSDLITDFPCGSCTGPRVTDECDCIR